MFKAANGDLNPGQHVAWWSKRFVCWRTGNIRRMTIYRDGGGRLKYNIVVLPDNNKDRYYDYAVSIRNPSNLIITGGSNWQQD